MGWPEVREHEQRHLAGRKLLLIIFMAVIDPLLLSSSLHSHPLSVPHLSLSLTDILSLSLSLLEDENEDLSRPCMIASVSIQHPIHAR